jgi:hypothetical protein
MDKSDNLHNFFKVVGPQELAPDWNNRDPVWLTDSQLVLPPIRNGGASSEPNIVNLTVGPNPTLPGLPQTDVGNTISVSPNGKWILWTDTSKGASIESTCATRLPDGKTVRWNDFGDHWLSDNRHVVFVGELNAGISPETGRPYGADGVIILDTQTGKIVHKILPQLESENMSVVQTDQSGNMIVSASPSFSPQSGPAVTLYRFNPLSNPLKVQTLEVTPPIVTGSQGGTFSIMPNSNGILWCYESYASASTLPFLQSQATCYDEFYVTNIDGSGVRKIGYLTNVNCQGPTSVSPGGDKFTINVRNQAAVISMPRTMFAQASTGVWKDLPTPPVQESPAQAAAEEKQELSRQHEQALSAGKAGQPLPDSTVNAVGVSGPIIYAGTERGLSVSRDSGRHWNIPDILAGINITRIAASGSIAYAGTYDGLFVTKDGGVTWKKDILTRNGHPVGTKDGPQALRVMNIACDGQTVCVSTMAAVGGLYVSHNGGATWTSMHVSSEVYVGSNAMAVSGSNIYIGATDGLYVSRDAGTTFGVDDGLQKIEMELSDVEEVAVSGSTIYAVRDHDVCVSNDNGATWARREGYFLNDGTRICAFKSTLCSASLSYGVGISTDSGVNLRNLLNIDGMAPGGPNDIAISGSTICVGSGGGLSLSTDNGSSWKSFQ